MKNKVLEVADDKGYDIQYQNNKFIVKEDDIVYYYKRSLRKISLEKIYTELAPVTDDYKVEDNIGKLAVTVVGKDKVDVTLEDKVIDINNQGKELVFNQRYGFVCSPEFTLESIDQKDIITKMAKAEKYYNGITKHYISGEGLREIYERGESIAKELNMEL